MYLPLFLTLACLSTCHSFNEHDASDDCNFLQHIKVSMELKKTGFHRELVTTIRFNNSGLLSKILLLYSWPKDIYVDPFQLASLGDQRNWEMLLDSTIDLETPAHKSSGFVTYLFPHLEQLPSAQVNLTIPIHGRYQKPSHHGNALNSVDIHPPSLLLWAIETCTQLSNLSSFTTTVVVAPCTANNSSTCQWIEVHPQQQPDPVTLELPVGDASLVIPVCGGTLLVTIICTVSLSKSTWARTYEM
ncbi:phosphatidylinositol-glycan biosynthesis class X protein [Periophthalmus magnuspinnatus]|uniref:phosphatidylinositol-glycan biosynthesis class X protein n=1 Tax=Periophthalmus magnuspinnatus TaxID=409849 RepID=UPI00243653ED|nr:phosphatidylinositol-glycan biosynthesis class X protein [Periophthalmus magnuspinnatus]